MGAEAALAVLEAKPETAPCVICLDGNKITKRPLMECVEKVCMSMFFCVGANYSTQVLQSSKAFTDVYLWLLIQLWSSLLYLAGNLFMKIWSKTGVSLMSSVGG